MANDVHEEFKKKMQEAWNEYEPDGDDLDPPAPDLSFLDGSLSKDMEPDEMDLGFLSEKKKRRVSFSRMGKVAAVLVAIFVTSSGLAVFMNSDASYGVKGIFQNIKNQFSPEKEPSMDDQGMLTLEVTEWENLEAGKELMPTLYIPQYIPSGYAFSKCTFNKTEGSALSSYVYVKGKDAITIAIEDLNDSMDIYVDGKQCKSPYSNKELYVSEEDGEHIVVYIEENLYIQVSSMISMDESIKVLEGVAPAK